MSTGKRKISSLFILSLVFVVIAGSTVTFGADWPIYRGPDHNGITSETDWKGDFPASGPRQLWKKSIGMGFSSMTISNGRVYAMGNSGKKGPNPNHDTVFCFDANTGREIWTHTYPCPLEPKYYEGGTLSTPTVDGKSVYTISKMGHLYCLDADTGNVKWQKNMNKDLGFELPTWHFSGSPLVIGNMLILNLGDAGVALNKNNGNVIWDNGKGICGYATPVPFTMDGEKCVAIFGASHIRGVRISDGKVLWESFFENEHKVNAADPIIIGNEVFVSNGYNYGCAKLKINGSAVQTVWKNKNMRNHMNCTMYWKGYLYGFDENKLTCLDFKDGSIKWSDSSMGKGALMMSADGRMIVISDKGELAIARANPEKLDLISKAQILPRAKCWTTPILANGKIYARNANGDLVCVDVSG
ncbi:MAG: PQQ-binding-like beta-propeller repeat protein [Sedimentisphaerales bacterium]|nr:PQQ-binding-like beta-propeller repeat protein [Sedimentisphaerales bacterium]